MPGITLTLSRARDAEHDRTLVEAVTALGASILDKSPERTMVILRHVDPADWFIAGRSLAEWGQRSFRLEVTVTDETVTKDQKAAFAHAAFERLSALLGNVHPHSNIHIVDCRASSYSYGGVTQERFALERGDR